MSLKVLNYICISVINTDALVRIVVWIVQWEVAKRFMKSCFKHWLSNFEFHIQILIAVIKIDVVVKLPCVIVWFVREHSPYDLWESVTFERLGREIVERGLPERR